MRCAKSCQCNGPRLVASRYSMHCATAARAHHVACGNVSGWRVRTKPRREKETGAIAAGVAFASGCPEWGSVCGATRSPTREHEAVASLQWIGTNNEPAGWSSLTMTFMMQTPCAVEIRAKAP